MYGHRRKTTSMSSDRRSYRRTNNPDEAPRRPVNNYYKKYTRFRGHHRHFQSRRPLHTGGYYRKYNPRKEEESTMGPERQNHNVLSSMTKSKLVTLCSTQHNEFSAHYPQFDYVGKSRSENKKVNISMPSYENNLMFYEHYDKISDQQCSRLAFVYVGGDSFGKVPYELSEYRAVRVVDFSSSYSSVYSTFYAVSQLKNCEEVRYHLDGNNRDCTKDDLRFCEQNMAPQVSMSVKRLVILKSEDSDGKLSYHQGGGAYTKMRLDCILFYALHAFPNLKSVRIRADGATGGNYDNIRVFLNSKGLAHTHKLTLKDELIACDPVNLCRLKKKSADVDHPTWNFHHGHKRDVDMRENSTALSGATSEKISPPCKRIKEEPGPSYHRPTFDLEVNETNVNSLDHKHLISIKVEVTDGKSNVIPEREPSPPPPPIPVVDITSDDGSDEEKKLIKVPVSNQQEIKEKPTWETSTSTTDVSEVTRNPCLVKNDTRQGSLDMIGSSYEDWEKSDSDDETETCTSISPSPVPSIRPPDAVSDECKRRGQAQLHLTPEALSGIEIDPVVIQNILNNVPLNRKERKDRRHRISVLKEGVHYDRRPKLDMRTYESGNERENILP